MYIVNFIFSFRNIDLFNCNIAGCCKAGGMFKFKMLSAVTVADLQSCHCPFIHLIYVAVSITLLYEFLQYLHK